MEIYKFEFAHWMRYYVDIENDSLTKIAKLSNDSQQISYTNGIGKGIQFIGSSGREKRSVFFTEDDARIIKKISQVEEVTKEIVESRTMSYTGLTSWLGTMIPYEYVPNPTTDFVDVFKYMYPDDHVPGSGIDYFKYGQNKCQILKKYIKSNGVNTNYIDLVNNFRKRIGLKPVIRYGEIDYNWIVEDIHLFIHRVVLELKDTSYLTLNQKMNLDKSEGSVERALTIISRLKRNTNIVIELKEKYNYSCQLCHLSSENYRGRFVEGAHIKPLGEPHNGVDSKENLLILCPNHHRLFDLGEWTIDQISNEAIPSKQKIKIEHSLDTESIRYHKENIYLNQ
jgi:hypothetical protein